VSAVDGGTGEEGKLGTSIQGRERISICPTRSEYNFVIIWPYHEEETVCHGSSSTDTRPCVRCWRNDLDNVLVRWWRGEWGEDEADGHVQFRITVPLEGDSTEGVIVGRIALCEDYANGCQREKKELSEHLD